MARKKPFSRSTAPPTSATHERTSQVVFSELPLPAPEEQEPIASLSSKPSAPAEVPASWLDRLLTLTWELPIHEGEEAVVRTVVEAISELLPTCGVGACFVGPGNRQQVIRKHPVEGGQSAVDPTRLFPGYEHEMILEVPGDTGGSTLHAACDDDDTLRVDGPSVRLLRRAAQVLRRGLEHARSHITMKGARNEVNALTAQMVQAEKLASLGQIAAGMVHELNNPLTSIVAYSDYLMKRWHAKVGQTPPADPDELERLRRIGESAHRLLRFTRDLVSYARPSGDIPIPVVLHGVIDQALAFCEHVLLESSASVDRHFGEGVLPVRGLPEQLTQVFVNLITNACHAMPPGGGSITITTDLTDGDGRVRVTVTDTGHGIPSQNVDRVFVPFFTTKGDGKGTGLGLAIVKSIVEGHGGQITVESEPAVREGTQFILLLPVASR